MSGQTKTRTHTAHAHFYRPFPSDPRFQQCACGATQRGDRVSDNPLIQTWGYGPAGQTCGQCAHLVAMKQSKTWYKCRLRGDLTHSARTDQRLKWEACGRFLEREEGR